MAEWATYLWYSMIEPTILHGRVILSEHAGQRFHRRIFLDPGEAIPTDEQAKLMDRQRLRLRHHSGSVAL